MIQVRFEEPNSQAWLEWLEDAKQGAELVVSTVKGGGRPAFNDALYKRMRDDLYRAFHDKCAYCESKFTRDQPGDIDHFRPKAAVTDENDRPVEVQTDNGACPHPGYYWLAYDWSNLLPTCANCNRPRRLADGRLVGKSTRFPVKGPYAWRPGLEKGEKAYFIHPLFENPGDHLGLDGKTGLMFPKSERGAFCIEKLALNRDALVAARMRAYLSVQAHWTQYNALVNVNYELAKPFMDYIEDCVYGRADVSWAGRIAFFELRKNLSDLRRLLDSTSDSTPPPAPSNH